MNVARSFAHQRLTESLRAGHARLDGVDQDAVVSHWLQNQSTPLPGLSHLMSGQFVDALQSLGSIKKRSGQGSVSGTHPINANLSIDWSGVPFPPTKQEIFTFVDLFAGIGGFRIAMQSLGGKCVFSSEWDVFAKKTYAANFGEVPFGDIRSIDAETIPDHDVLCAGFPCQPFSLAGVSARTARKTSHGFACETQGTLFFDIVRIVRAKLPRIVFLENVKNLVSHDHGRTFAVIKNAIEEIGYSFHHKVIDASALVPQKRMRCYMVCVREAETTFDFPDFHGDPIPLKSILEKEVPPSFTISDKLWAGHQRRTARNVERGVGFTAYCADIERPANTIVARYGKDGKECLIPQKNINPRMLTPRECARLQGFPEHFAIPDSKAAAYRQFGNSVAIPVVRAIAERFLPLLPRVR